MAQGRHPCIGWAGIMAYLNFAHANQHDLDSAVQCSVGNRFDRLPLKVRRAYKNIGKIYMIYIIILLTKHALTTQWCVLK